MKSLLIGFFVVISTVSFAGDSSICVNDRVLDTRDNTTGIVKEVFSNGIAKVRFDGYSIDDSVKVLLLSRSTRMQGRFSIGARVLDTGDNTTGKIEELFDNGMAKVRFDGYSVDNSILVRKLALSKSCLLENICVDNRVLDTSDNITGTIRELFDNGMAKVRFDGYSVDDSIPLSRLGYEIYCSMGNCHN